MPVSALLENGWELVEDGVIPAKEYMNIGVKRNDSQINNLYVRNCSEYACNVEDAVVEYLSTNYLKEEEFMTSGGLNKEMTEDEFLDLIKDKYYYEVREDSNFVKTYEIRLGDAKRYCVVDFNKDGTVRSILLNLEDEGIINSISIDEIKANSKITYTEGSVTGNTYINEWAGIEMTFPDNFKEASEEEYQSLTNEITDCGMYFKTLEGTNIMLLIEDVSMADDMDAEKYCQLISEQVEEEMIGKMEELLQGEKADFQFRQIDKGSEKEVASAVYHHVSHRLDISVRGMQASMVQSYYMRKIDTRILAFIVSASDIETCDEIMSYIKPIDSF